MRLEKVESGGGEKEGIPTPVPLVFSLYTPEDPVRFIHPGTNGANIHR